MRTVKKQMSAAYRYSYSRLVLNYYSLYEIISETENLSPKLLNSAGEFHHLFASFLDHEIDLTKLDTLREQVKSGVEVITAYIDCFQIYEYALNRMERRFLTLDPMVESLEEFVDILMEFLMKSKDQLVLNDRIQQVIGQLPIRYTKQKFYSLLQDGLSIYIGSEKKSLDRMLYLLRTEAMIQLPKEMETDYSELHEILEQLQSTDYLHMSKELYEVSIEKIICAGKQLNADADLYLLLQDLINDLYVLCLAESETMIELSEKQILESIATAVLKEFQAGHTSVIADKITERLYELEGRQESAMEQFMSCPMPEAEDKDPVSVKLRTIEKLLSESSFASLEEESEESETADSQWVEKQVAQLMEDLNQVFGQQSKPVVRAIMAKLLSTVPSAFRSVDELHEYLLGSLESCGDWAEREACMEVLHEIMEIEDALV